VIEYGELERIAASAHSRQVMQIIEMHKKKHDDGAVVTKLDFAAFRKFFASRASLDVKDGRGDSALHRAVAKGSSYQQQARVIFNSIDRQGDGYIDAEELGYLLLGYSLPFGDVEAVLRKHDTSGDGRISFDEFCASFRPLVHFQIGELRKTVAAASRQLVREADHTRMVRQKSRKLMAPSDRSVKARAASVVPAGDPSHTPHAGASSGSDAASDHATAPHAYSHHAASTNAPFYHAHSHHAASPARVAPHSAPHSMPHSMPHSAPHAMPHGHSWLATERPWENMAAHVADHTQTSSQHETAKWSPAPTMPPPGSPGSSPSLKQLVIGQQEVVEAAHQVVEQLKVAHQAAQLQLAAMGHERPTLLPGPLPNPQSLPLANPRPPFSPAPLVPSGRLPPLINLPACAQDGLERRGLHVPPGMDIPNEHAVWKWRPASTSVLGGATPSYASRRSDPRIARN